MKSAFAINIEYYAFMGASGIICRLPLNFCYWLAELCGVLFFFLDAKHRTRVVQHLLHAGGKEGMEAVFFGHPAMTHTLPALLHLKTGIPIVVLMPRRVDDNFKFDFILSEPITMTPSGDKEGDVKDLVQRYTSEIEKVISCYPEQWMWAHRRWVDINR